LPSQRFDNADHMSYHFLEKMREVNPTWRLIASTHAPMVVSFLYKEFIAENKRNISESELAGRLDIYIYMLRQDNEQTIFMRMGKEYLNEWADENHGWLRKFYPPGSDNPHYDVTPQAEKAIEWLLGLRQQSFIGAESRLLTVFELLRQIVARSESDPKLRIVELVRQKSEIEQEIIKAERGEIILLDDIQIKERFAQAMSTAWEILADFRAVEQNFRNLDRNMRERIATWDKGKGELLEAIFNETDGISSSEQGKSFAAFWNFLMSSATQEAFSDSLNRAFELKPVQEMGYAARSRHIQNDWVDAGSQVQETVAALSQQLRRYVDEAFLDEERRIKQILREIEGKAIAIKDVPPQDWNLEIDGLCPEIRMPLDRPMFNPPSKSVIKDDGIVNGDGDLNADALYSQIYVDKDKLRYNIDYLLKIYDRITLSQIIDIFPLEHGLTELLTYFVIISESDKTLFIGGESEDIFWDDENGARKIAKVPKVLFLRSESTGEKRS